MTYDIALFDLDGTLTDPKAGITKSLAYALSALGIEVTDLDTLTQYIGPPLRNTFRAGFGLTQKQTEQAVKKYLERYSKIGLFENILYPGIIELLKRLKNKGLKMAVATSKYSVNARRIAEHFEFAPYFDFIGGAEPDGRRDTKSEVIEYTLDKLDPNRKLRSVMIGDRNYDIIGARQTRIDCIGILWGYGSRAELESAGAVRIVETVSGLGDLLCPLN